MDRRQFGLLVSGVLVSHRSIIAQNVGGDGQPLRVGVIGHTGRGNYGHGLDVVWQSVESTSIAAVADADPPGLSRAVSKLGLDSEVGFRDYSTMLDKVRPDIVAVCPRQPDQHRDMILAAIDAGVKGLYVEKPFLRTPSEVDDVVRACQQNNTKLAVAHRNRYHPVLQTIDQLIEQGRIGRLLEIRGRGKGDRRGGGEDLWVLGCHVMNLISYFGGPAKSCSAVMLQDGRLVTMDDVYDGPEALGPIAGNEIHARYLLKNGITATFDSIANDGTQNHGFGLQLIGSEGMIAIQADRDPVAYMVQGNPFQPSSEPRRWQVITSGGVDVPEPITNLHHQVHTHIRPASDLVAAIREDRRPLCHEGEGAMTVEMICGVFESHRQGGRAVAIPLKDRVHPLTRQ